MRFLIKLCFINLGQSYLQMFTRGCFSDIIPIIYALLSNLCFFFLFFQNNHIRVMEKLKAVSTNQYVVLLKKIFCQQIIFSKKIKYSLKQFPTNHLLVDKNGVNLQEDKELINYKICQNGKFIQNIC